MLRIVVLKVETKEQSLVPITASKGEPALRVLDDEVGNRQHECVMRDA